MTKPNKAKQSAILEVLGDSVGGENDVVEIIYREHLAEALKKGGLRVKLGIDPTTPNLHLGHAVVLRKLRQFQDLGNKAVLIIGDFTGRIGDPSGRSKERPHLTQSEIKKNMKKYLAQAGKILDTNKPKFEIRYNSEWLGKSVENILELARAGSVQQILQRADFKTRINEGNTITLLETFYPLLQGYDSVNVRADVEIGGTDQLLNLLTGRHVQRYFDKPEQDILIVPLLEGTDGTKKMSKSENNYIALDDSPNEMFRKIMSIPDKLISKYFELCTDVTIGVMETEIGKLKPRDAKARLAYEIVKLYHGEKAAGKAEDEFWRAYTSRGKDVPESWIKTTMVDDKNYTVSSILTATGATSSTSAARRLVEQGGVKISDEIVSDSSEEVKIPEEGLKIQIGKKRFWRAKKK